MKLAVIGAGMMGSAAAWDLARSEDVDEVRVADISAEKLTALKARLGDTCVTRRIDVTNGESLRRFLKGTDAAVSALPHGAVHPADVAAVECGAKLVNIAFEDEQMALDGRAKETGAVLIPGCGVAPGLSNILVAHGARELEEPLEGHIYVGGLPQRPEGPLSYHLVFSVKGLIREYLTARIVRAGKVVSVEPFAEVESVRFRKPLGTLEAFFTDGLGSSVYSLRWLKQLDERTLRYPGHAQRVKFLMEAGFFSEGSVRVGHSRVSPVEVSGAVLERLLTRGDPRDLTVLRVMVSGRDGGRTRTVTFELLDYFDERHGISSMGRTTAFTAAIVARMLGRGELQAKGVVPPETGLEREHVRTLLRELGSRGVVVRRKRA